MTTKNQVIIRLKGRMANQMFQWAVGRAIFNKTGLEPLFDDSEETSKLTVFNIDFKKYAVKKPLRYKLFRKIIPIRNLRNKITKIQFDLPRYKEDSYYKYDANIFKITPPVYIDGYFQTAEYFKELRTQLLEDFKLRSPLDKKNQKMLKKIQNTDSISIHFRRGDYLKSSHWGTCSIDYYKNSIDLIAKEANITPTLFIFSDDTKWVKENVKFPYETIYVDINNSKHGFFDFELMKNCKYNIIANSSFSWWAAWLNENPSKIVVAPQPWRPKLLKEFEYDLIPNEWRRVEADYENV